MHLTQLLAGSLFLLISLGGACMMLMGWFDHSRYNRSWLGGELEPYRMMLAGSGCVIGGLAVFIVSLTIPSGHVASGLAALAAEASLALALALIAAGLLLEPLDAAWS